MKFAINYKLMGGHYYTIFPRFLGALLEPVFHGVTRASAYELDKFLTHHLIQQEQIFNVTAAK